MGSREKWSDESGRSCNWRRLRELEGIRQPCQSKTSRRLNNFHRRPVDNCIKECAAANHRGDPIAKVMTRPKVVPFLGTF
jgi:hypothetical protein